LGPLTRLTFDNLIPQGRRDDPAEQQRFTSALETAKTFAREPEGWLVLIGPSGCGKTHLAAAIANYRLHQGYPVIFISVPDLLDHLRATFSPASEIPYDELFEQVRNAPLLVLDDLGTQSSTPWAKEKLDQLINHRYNTRLPTVVTTSTPVEELGERLSTRLTDPLLCHICVLEHKYTTLEQVEGLELELLRGMTFENFDHHRIDLPSEQRQTLEETFRAAHSFAQSPDGWLVFQGTNGCGKTHLAAAIANHRRQESKPVTFVVVPDFLDHLRSTFSPESKVSYDELFERVRKAPLLILDDFGEHSGTPWAQEKLYQVINYRYNARLATVITTCLSLDEIEPRISSRMVDLRLSAVYNITAPDYRAYSTQRARPPLRRSRRSRPTSP
jgi:DNA replication protein DnaC